MFQRFLSALLLLALVQGVPARAEDTAISLMANSWPPYVDSKLPEQGLALELVTHIYRQAGYAPEVEITMWTRAMRG